MRSKIGVTACLLLFLSPLLHAESNAESKAINIGMSTALSGPAQYLGQSMHAGVKAAFDRANEEGGIQGTPINLIVKDDSYQPESALNNVQQLIKDERVLALIGNVGTPTAALTAPYANDKKVVFFAAYSGAATIRQEPPQPYVFNLRASYDQEAKKIVEYIFKQGIKPVEIAFLLQQDSYGDAGYSATKKALEAHRYYDSNSLLKTYYPRNTLDIEQAIVELLGTHPIPRAIIIVGAYAPSAKFINYAQFLFKDSLFFNLSFTGAPALASSLTSNNQRVFITQVVPEIAHDLKISQEFTRDMKRFSPLYEEHSISFEGYLAGRTFVAALENINGPITREKIRTAFESLDIDFGLGYPIQFDDTHQASNAVWLSQYDGTAAFVPLANN